MKKNGKQTALIVAVAVLAVALIGVTYAWLTQRLEAENTNVIKAGTFELRYMNESAGISLDGDKATPVSDDTGKAYTPYSFTVTNTGTYEAAYTVYLDEYKEYDNQPIDFMNETIIKYQLKKSLAHEASNTEEKNYNDSEEISTIDKLKAGTAPSGSQYQGAKILGSGTLKAGQEVDYSLTLWIDSSATREIINGKTFIGKVRVEGTYQANSTGE